MAINPFLTDQLAAEARDTRHHERCAVPDTVPSLIDRLRAQLPGVDEQLLGEILLHTAAVADATELLLMRRGVPAYRIASTVTELLAEAGTRLYRAS